MMWISADFSATDFELTISLASRPIVVLIYYQIDEIIKDALIKIALTQSFVIHHYVLDCGCNPALHLPTPNAFIGKYLKMSLL